MALHDDYDDDMDDRPPPRRRRFDDADDEREYDFRKRDLPHSGIGVASVVLAVLAGVIMLGLLVVAGVMAGDDAGGLDEDSPEMMALGTALVGACLLAVVGLGLGIGAVVQKDRKKLFGILGLIANGLVVLGTVVLMCIGAAME